MCADGVLDTCLHRELLKAGVEPEECTAACRKLSDAASDAARLVEAARQRNRCVDGARRFRQRRQQSEAGLLARRARRR